MTHILPFFYNQGSILLSCCNKSGVKYTIFLSRITNANFLNKNDFGNIVSEGSCYLMYALFLVSSWHL